MIASELERCQFAGEFDCGEVLSEHATGSESVTQAHWHRDSAVRNPFPKRIENASLSDVAVR